MTALTIAEQRADLLATLRHMKGRATVGDVVAGSGLPVEDVRAGLRGLLESHRGHLAVADSGELVYEFDPRLIERGTEPWLARARRAATRVVTAGFKAWIVVMLVVYFVVFVALLVAALLSGQRGNDSRGGWGGGRGGRRAGGHFHFDPLLWYWIWSPRWRIGRPYYGHRWERTLGEGDKVPFYKKVFAFVFGPDRPNPTQQQIDRAKLRLIRARAGVLTNAELVGHTGSTFDEAEEEMGRLLGAYEGEAVVSPDGELVYAFPGVMASLKGTRSVRPPNPAWLRLERAQELTGNTVGANLLVGGMNAFTLVAAATAPYFIFPRLGLGGPAAFIGLVLVPLVFSVVFFAAPALRMAGVALENRRRTRRNVRRVLLGYVYEEALAGRTVNTQRARDYVASRLQSELAAPPEVVDSHLATMAKELDAQLSVEDDGSTTYAFDSIRKQLAASETVRTKLRLEEREIGDIVYSTADSAGEADERELALFDRELVDEGVDLGGYLPAADRVDYEDDYEVVLFEEELARR